MKVLRNTMKNLKIIGLPSTLLFEGLLNTNQKCCPICCDIQHYNSLRYYWWEAELHTCRSQISKQEHAMSNMEVYTLFNDRALEKCRKLKRSYS